MSNSINFILDGKKISWEGSASDRFLDVLRDEFQKTGTKCGCKEGECGACSVIIDDVLINSCMVAMGSLEGCDVVTIDGYKETDRFKVMEKAYAAVSAVQCGYCIPGMVLASECILAKNPHPTKEEVRVGISGNLCRCTGYNAIVEAVMIASREGEGLW